MKMVLVLAAALGGAVVVALVAKPQLAAVPARAEAARSVAASEGDRDEPASGVSLTGVVQETIDVADYTYLRLATDGGELWAAVGKAPAQVGSRVTVSEATRMEQFESASLKRTFPVIYFGNLAGASQSELPAGHPPLHGAATEMPPGHPPIAGAASAPASNGVVPRASGANARTIDELYGRARELQGERVRVRGQVVKVTAGVLGKTYLRLRDGSSEDAARRELVVTTQAEPSVRAVLTVEGTVRTDVDVGIGYRYAVLVEDATIATEP